MVHLADSEQAEQRRALRWSAPGRLLVLSADMGGGHNAAADAIEETARRLWPGAEIERLDTLRVMGHGVGPLFRRIYVANVQSTPWLYELFYAALWRHRWFARASKNFVGAWCGLQLHRQLVRRTPDLVLTTYPLATAGMAWLRRRGRTSTRTAAWVTDFAPHPFWVYADVDLTLVLHERCLPWAGEAEPGATLRVGALPVAERFSPCTADRSDGPLRVLISCGALGFGTVERAVDAALAVGPQVRVQAVCGRNETLRRRLAARIDDRLEVLGWAGDMPRLLADTDVVVGNAGGATALEAWACGLPVVMYDPIAAHGRANAELMQQADLSVTCHSEAELTAHLRELATEPNSLRRAAEQIQTYVGSTDLADDLAHLATLGSPATQGSPATRKGATESNGPTTRRAAPTTTRVRSRDAFFLHVETPHVAQQIGAMLRFGPVDGTGLQLSAVRAIVADRLPGMPSLGRQLTHGTSPWRRPQWVETNVCIDRHLGARRVRPVAVADAVDAFFSSQLPRDRPLWRMDLLQGLPGDESLLLIKLHHALGDGLSAVTTLDRLLDTADEAHDRRSTRRTNTGGPHIRTRLEAGRVARGLFALARHGRAGPSVLSGPMTGSARHIVTVRLDLGAVRAVARALSARSSELLVTLFAAAVAQALDEAGSSPTTVRAMVPVSLRGRTAVDSGNWTGAASIDLPVAAMPPAERLARVRCQLTHRVRGDEPYAARAVMLALGALPHPLHGVLARAVYQRAWFHGIVSYMPGRHRPRQLAGADLLETYPVLPLAEGVGLAAGLLAWSGEVCVGITVDPTLVPGADLLAGALVSQLGEFARAAGLDDLAQAPG